MIYRSIVFAAVVFALAALPACSAGSLLNATPVPVAFAISGSAPAVGKTSQLNGVAQMSDGSSKDVTSQAAWTSSNTAIATVSSSGLLTGIASGSVTISATYQGFTSNSLILTIP